MKMTQEVLTVYNLVTCHLLVGGSENPRGTPVCNTGRDDRRIF